MCATSFVCVVLLFWACQLVFDIFIEPSVREAISQVCRCGLGANSGALILSAVGGYHASAAAATASSSVRRLRVRGLQQRFHPSFVHRSTRVRARRRDVTTVDERIDLTYVRAVHPAATEREPTTC